jgi:hypothetical protein
MSKRKLSDFRAQFRVDDPEIHPEDACDAILAWFQRSCRNRRKPPHIILEKALISRAVEKGVGIQAVYRNHRGEILDVRDKGFETRWKRARKDRCRKPWLDEIDIFILRNWRVIRFPELAERGCPGLCEWSPRAATALIRSLTDATNAGDEAWYTQKRLRLGLSGKRRYRVRDFLQHKDGHREIEID